MRERVFYFLLMVDSYFVGVLQNKGFNFLSFCIYAASIDVYTAYSFVLSAHKIEESKMFYSPVDIKNHML